MMDISAASRGQTENLHGTAIALGGHAVLLRGASGAGKSDLALRCIALAPGPLVTEAAMLVADDRVIASADEAGVVLKAPAALQGLIEVRGIGIVRVPFVASARLVLVADLASPSDIERMPEPRGERVVVGGCAVQRFLIAPFEAAAPVKLLLALMGVVGADTPMR